MAHFFTTFRPLLRRLQRAQDGIAAVEFALCLPFLLMLFLGGFELGRLLLVHQKVERVAYTVADVVTQQTSITIGQLEQMLSGAGQIMLPHPFDEQGRVILSSVYRLNNQAPSIRWQYSGGGMLEGVSGVGSNGGSAVLPGSLAMSPRENVIVAEVFYRYEPLLPVGFIQTHTISKSVVLKPRLGVLTTPPS